MVKLNKIYTKTGDDGTTGLGNGERCAKYDLRVESYGSVDETNAFIGMARVHLAVGSDHGANSAYAALDKMLARIQNDLFDLGADLCCPMSDDEEKGSALRMVASQVERIEQDIDVLNEKLSPLRSFILPGGTALAASLHVARTVSRRAERLVVELAGRDEERINLECVHYLNRISDFLFVAARYVNNFGEDDVLWVPGENRGV